MDWSTSCERSVPVVCGQRRGFDSLTFVPRKIPHPLDRISKLDSPGKSISESCVSENVSFRVAIALVEE